MIPVINLKKLREAVEAQTPEQKRKNRVRSRELLNAAMASVEKHKAICEELGIPYVPCVAADPYGTRYYDPSIRPTGRVRLGDTWPS